MSMSMPTSAAEHDAANPPGWLEHRATLTQLFQAGAISEAAVRTLIPAAKQLAARCYEAGVKDMNAEAKKALIEVFTSRQAAAQTARNLEKLLAPHLPEEHRPPAKALEGLATELLKTLIEE